MSCDKCSPRRWKRRAWWRQKLRVFVAFVVDPEWETWRAYYSKSLSRRVEIENEMFRAVAGDRPMPTRQELREWALRLGVPDELR